jgi:GNAT superfamily N-acetyltransferase
VTAFTIQAVRESRGAICREILAELPEWFGIPEAIDHYVEFAEGADMLGIIAGDVVGGFVVLRNTSEAACDVYVMAVRRSLHRLGLGKALIRAASSWAKARGRRYLTVKTIGPSLPNAAYEITRAFYASAGFEPIEEFPDLWEGNPCLLMLKPV